MPQINNIPEVLYQPNQPYHYHYDNMPLRNILRRIDLVNIQVDTNTDILMGASGSAGTLRARLQVSLNESGGLKPSAVDTCNHSIAAHEDTDEFVRMTIEERSRLDSMADSANKLYVKVAEVTFDADTLTFQDSDTVYFENVAPNKVTANVNFPLSSAHRHYYGVDPVFVSSSSSGSSYKTTISDTSFMEGSLRVYVNGVRLSEFPYAVRVWDGSSWNSTHVSSQNYELGVFSLNRILGANEIVRIDFDESFLLSSSSSS